MCERECEPVCVKAELTVKVFIQIILIRLCKKVNVHKILDDVGHLIYLYKNNEVFLKYKVCSKGFVFLLMFVVVLCLLFFPPFLLMHLFTYFVQQLYFNEHSCFSALLQYVSPFILFESQCISSLSFSLISLSVDCYKKNIQSRVSSLLSLERLTEISIDCKINKM